MSLKLVLNEKTIKNRYELLSTFLKNNKCGELNDDEKQYFKHIFIKYYTPDEEYTKFNFEDIIKVSITLDNWNKKCFSIYVNDTWFPTSIKRLAGSNRNEMNNLIRALRNAIQYQIIEYRNKNKLNPNEKCPIINENLGIDAQIDHEIPFHILSNEWLKNHSNVKYSYDLNEMNYILQEPYLQEWREYHLLNAKLRWVSKNGNKIAHKLYIN